MTTEELEGLEPQQREERKKELRAYPRITTTKKSAKGWGYLHLPRVQRTIKLMGDAPFIDALNTKLAVVSNELRGVGNFTNAINVAFCTAIDLMLEALDEQNKYSRMYANGEYNAIPQEWLNMFAKEAALKARMAKQIFKSDIENIWYPEYISLGEEQFREKYGYHANIEEIVAACSDYEELQPQENEDQLTGRIRTHLKALAEMSTDTIFSIEDIEASLIRAGVLPEKESQEYQKAKGILKYLGTKDKLSSGKRGYWNLGVYEQLVGKTSK